MTVMNQVFIDLFCAQRMPSCVKRCSQLSAFLLSVSLVSILASCSTSESLVACGEDSVFIVKHDPVDPDDHSIIWHWKVTDATDLDPDFHKRMVPTDDCKPVLNNSKLLITSSGGGVILLDIKRKKSLFYAHVPNAHSAELLPNERMVVALSTAIGGNAIELYNLNKSDRVLYRDSLYSGHGVVWMPKLKRLFALGYDELRAYSLVDWSSNKPSLRKDKTWTLPEESGHDLVSVSDDELLLTTHEGAWSFKISAEEFTPFAPLEKVPDIKSIYFNERNGRIIYTKGETSWWTHRILALSPDKTIQIPDVKMYKVRVMK